MFYLLNRTATTAWLLEQLAHLCACVRTCQAALCIISETLNRNCQYSAIFLLLPPSAALLTHQQSPHNLSLAYIILLSTPLIAPSTLSSTSVSLLSMLHFSLSPSLSPSELSLLPVDVVSFSFTSPLNSLSFLLFYY